MLVGCFNAFVARLLYKPCVLFTASTSRQATPTLRVLFAGRLDRSFRVSGAMKC